MIEDGPKTGDYLCKELTESCFAVNLARTGIEGEMLALSGEYDLIVLDVMLPGRDGRQILQTLRKSNPVRCCSLARARRWKTGCVGWSWGPTIICPSLLRSPKLLARTRSLLRRGVRQMPNTMLASMNPPRPIKITGLRPIRSDPKYAPIRARRRIAQTCTPPSASRYARLSTYG